MSLKLTLLSWAVKTFGENDLDDLMSVREEILPTKKPTIYVKKITLFVKKRIGINKDWLKVGIANEWREALKDIIGDHLKMEIQSIEGNELKMLSGLMEKDEFKEVPPTAVYNYQFNLELLKKINIRGKSNAGAKPKI